MSESSINSKLICYYALPSLPVYFLFGPITILQGMYAKYFGISLSAIASALLIARLFDAVTDPIVGYCSDRYYARKYSRKPFILLGGILFAVSSWFLYVPPDNVSFGYLVTSLSVFYLGYTLFEISHIAWGSELADHANEKNHLFGIRSACALLAGLFFYAMPLLPLFDTNEFTPTTLKWSAVIAGIVMLPMLLISLKVVPCSSRKRVDGCHTPLQRGKSPASLLKGILSNYPLLMFMSSYVFLGIGGGMWLVLAFSFTDAYLGRGDQFALVYMISSGLSIVSLRLWHWLAGLFGKQLTWGLGALVMSFGIASTGFLSPNNESFLPMLICMVLVFVGTAALYIMAPSLLSDIVDYGTWKFGRDYTATYFSTFTFLTKSVGALGGALGLAISAMFGFDPTTTIHSEEAIFGLRLSIAWMPFILIVISIGFIWQIPISIRQHTIIRRRLDALGLRL